MSNPQNLRTPWSAAYYAPHVTGSGAAKLADSGVAPLVAASRGYRTVDTKESLKQVRTMMRLGRGRPTKLETSFTQGAELGEDTLFLPWYRMGTCSHTRGDEPIPSVAQWRPSNPQPNSQGKVAKYLFTAGQRLVLDYHPATPDEWLRSSGSILIVEGLLKADSTLTQVLIEAGIPEEELYRAPEQPAAIARLHELMESVPAAKATVVIASAGVGTWHHAPEWNAIDLRQRRVYIAFDGDIRTNRSVWNQTDRLFNMLGTREAEARLVDLGGEAALAMQTERYPENGTKRLGMDDFLTRVGSWSDAKTLCRETLPEPPANDTKDPLKGEWRVDPDGCGVSEWVVGQDGVGSWVQRSTIGGRVVSVETGRTPTDDERITGSIDPAEQKRYEHASVTFELKWRDPLGEVCTTEVRGPIAMLITHPGDWHRRKILGELPSELALHPAFPPERGEKWLSAIKSHRSAETETAASWLTMGWVPTETGQPAFVVGNQVIAADEELASKVRAGVNDRILPGASRFGVSDIYPSCDSLDEYKAQIASDIRELIEKLVESGTLANKKIPALVIGAMFRPTIPIRPDATVSLYGPPGKGKSWVSGLIMSAWQSRPNTWHEKSLPGQAGDTPTSTEISLAQTPIWVADDLAVSADPRQAVNQEAAVSNLIRSVQNGDGRRRSNVDLTQREVHKPRAQFIMTAENELTVMSVRDRCVSLQIANGTFGPDSDEVENLKTWWKTSMVPSRITAAMIRMWIFDEFWQGREDVKRHIHGQIPTWEEKIAIADDMRDWSFNLARAAMIEAGIPETKVARHAANATNFTLTLRMLRQLAVWAGIPIDDPIVAKHLNELDPASLARRIHEISAETVRTQASSSPGLALLQALHNGLAAGRFHLLNPDDAGQPPVSGTTQEAMVTNQLLGWRWDPSRGEGTWVPRGVSIGYLAEDSRRDGTLYVHFSYEDAFQEARRAYPSLLPPGTKPKTTWLDLRGKNVLLPEVEEHKRDGVSMQVSLRAVGSSTASCRPSGVPVLLGAILTPTEVVGDMVSNRENALEKYQLTTEKAKELAQALVTVGAVPGEFIA